MTGAAAGAVYGLVAVGHSLVYRLTGVVNFALGDLVALGVFATLLVAAGTGPVTQTGSAAGGSSSRSPSAWSSARPLRSRATCSRSSRSSPAARPRLGRGHAGGRLRAQRAHRRLLHARELRVPGPAAVPPHRVGRVLRRRRRPDPGACVLRARRRRGARRRGVADAHTHPVRARPPGDRRRRGRRAHRRRAGRADGGGRLRAGRRARRARGDRGRAERSRSTRRPACCSASRGSWPRCSSASARRGARSRPASRSVSPRRPSPGCTVAGYELGPQYREVLPLAAVLLFVALRPAREMLEEQE